MTNRQAAAPTSEDVMLSLALAHARMTEALAILDAHSVLRAAATLDLAIHQLDRAIAGGL